jgi:hypothetical protein
MSENAQGNIRRVFDDTERSVGASTADNARSVDASTVPSKTNTTSLNGPAPSTSETGDADEGEDDQDDSGADPDPDYMLLMSLSAAHSKIGDSSDGKSRSSKMRTFNEVVDAAQARAKSAKSTTAEKSSGEN